MRRLLCFLLGVLTIGIPLKGGEMLYKSSFAKDAEGWTPKGNAVWRPAARKADCGSLSVSFEKEGDTLPSWQSPVIALHGSAAKISFFAADNYLKQQDYSYSAGFSVKVSDKNGVTSAELGRVYTEWDNSLVSPYMWGVRSEENLIWKYYELTIGPGQDYIRLNFDFRAPFVCGHCYLSEVCITRETPAASQKTETRQDSGLKLYLSSPAPGGIFFTNDSLRFDALLFAPGKKQLALPPDSTIRIKVTDFERNPLFKGEEKNFRTIPIQYPRFYCSDFAKKFALTQENHGVCRINVDVPAVKESGILFLLKAELVSGGKVLAQDTLLYGVTEPFRTVKNPEKSYFFTRDQGMLYYDGASTAEKSVQAQEFTAKTHSYRSASLDLSYDWSKYQKKYPGPILISDLLPSLPIHLYMPNIEQTRLGKMIPEGAKFAEKTPTYYAGRKDKLMFDYNPEAYADFIIEYVKKNRHAISHVIPAGLERPFSARVPVLQKKVYTELKKFDPSLQVGISVNFIPTDVFQKHELYKYTDFLNVHMYGSAVSFPFEHSVAPYREFYRDKLKRKVPPFTMTEGAMRPPPGYLNYAAGMVRGIWSLIANGFTGFYYYLQRNQSPLADPDLTDNITPDPHGSSYDNYRFVQLTARPIAAPEVVMEKGHDSKRWRSDNVMGGGCSIMPTPSTLAYINLIRDVDFLPFRRVRQCGGTRIYMFGDKTRTVCGLETLPGSPEQLLEVRTNVSYLFRDLLGRKTRVVPKNGTSLLQTGKYPVTLLFDAPADPKFIVREKGTLTLSPCTAGSELELSLQTPFQGETLTLESILSGPEGLGQTVPFQAEKTECSLTLSAGMQTGSRTFRAFLRSGGEVCGIWQTEVVIGEPLKIEVLPRVGGKRVPAGIEVCFANASAKPYSGRVRFEDRFFTRTFRPEIREKPFRVPGGGKHTVFFPVADEFVRTNFNEIIPLSVQFSDGTEREVKGRIHFRGVPHVEKPPVIDGELSDWDLAALGPVPLERIRMSDPDAPAGRERKSPGQCYAAWHGDTLYLAVVVKDGTPQSRRMDVNLWMDDNILVGLYPWRTATGEKLHAGYYREHIGLHKDGSVGDYREGKYAPPGGPATPAGVKAAVRRTQDGYVYEIAYPASSLYPLRIAPGSGFRLSLTNFDAQGFKDVPYFCGELSYFAGAMVNYNTNPEQWFEFLFTE